MNLCEVDSMDFPTFHQMSNLNVSLENLFPTFVNSVRTTAQPGPKLQENISIEP